MIIEVLTIICGWIAIVGIYSWYFLLGFSLGSDIDLSNYLFSIIIVSAICYLSVWIMNFGEMTNRISNDVSSFISINLLTLLIALFTLLLGYFIGKGFDYAKR